MKNKNQMKPWGKEEAAACDILIRNAYILSIDKERRIYPTGAIAITGKEIVAVGPERKIEPLFNPKEILDAGGAVVHPGFIDSHSHATLHLSRGAITDNQTAEKAIGYFDWLNQMSEEDEYISVLSFCAEMASKGYTAFMDAGTAFYPDMLAAAAEKIGVRASVSDPFLWDRPEGEDGLAATLMRAPCNLDRSLNVMGKELWRNEDSNSLISGHVSLYGDGSASDELIRAAKKCADDNDVVFNMHVNFTPETTEQEDLKYHGRHTLCHFSDLGVLGQNCTFAHMNIIRDDELKPIIESGMSIVWQPGNYLFYGISSMANSRMTELMDNHINVTFGVDVAKIWTFGDMEFVGYLVARHGKNNISPEKLLEMRTIGGAKALGLERMIGSIEPGKRADLVIRKNSIQEYQPGIDNVQEMMQLSRSDSVSWVIVNGKVVYKDGHLVNIDENKLLENAKSTTRQIMKRLDFSPTIKWPKVT